MDVSRIGPISPQQIDWRRLTAKEIIKYENQGVDVPNQYLQWAKEFVASVYSDDTTTYDMAVSAQTPPASAESPTASTEETPTEVSAAEEDTESENEEDTVEEDESATVPQNTAQIERETLNQNGVSLRNQARIFRTESNRRFWQTLIQRFGVSAVQKKSDTELFKLQHYMEAVLSRAESAQNEFRQQVDEINNGTSNSMTFAKMNMLQDRLQQYGNNGVAHVSSSEADFNEYQTNLDDRADVVAEAADYGVETVDIGNELLSSSRFNIIDIIVGNSAVKSGNRTSSLAERVGGTIEQATGINIANFNFADSYRAEIEDKTGVQSESASLTSRHSKEDNIEAENENDPANEEKIGTVEDENTHDPANDSSANIDKILQYKIRQAAVSDNPQT